MVDHYSSAPNTQTLFVQVVVNLNVFIQDVHAEKVRGCVTLDFLLAFQSSGLD